MGIVNVRKGLDDSNLETFNFNGSIRDNIDLNWEYTAIYLGSEKLDPDYIVKEDDIIIIQEYPAGTGTGNKVGDAIIGFFTGGIYTSIIAANQVKAVKKELQESLDRLKNQKNQGEQETIPWLSGGKNERALGKQVPIILGRHLFTPYFLSDPYLQISGEDGKDLFFYGTFICGQTGLVIERIRNGTTNLVKFEDAHPQACAFPFDEPDGYDPSKPPPFYDLDNEVEIVQNGDFINPIFDQKWSDSLESSVELGRKKRDTQVIDGEFIEDDDEPVIRESARFPMALEVEIFVDGLCGWDSENNEETTAYLDISLHWGTSDTNISTPFESPFGLGSGSWTSIGGVPGGGGYRLKRSTSKQMRFIAYLDLSNKGIYQTNAAIKLGDPVYIKATRLTNMRTGGYRDRVYLNAIRTKLYSPERSSISGLVEAKNLNAKLSGKLCRMGIKMKVNHNTERALDRFNIVASMTARTWNGYTWLPDKVKTSNPAAVALEVLTGLIHELSAYNDGYPYLEVDLVSFGRLYEFCNNQEVDIDGTTFGYPDIKLEANGVITSAARKIDVLRSILATCEAGLYVNEFGKIVVFHDAPQKIPIALLNPQRIVKMQESRNLDRRADGYKVDYIDEDADWNLDTEEILRPRVDKDLLNTFTSVKFDFVTNYYHAMWKARRMMAKEVHRPGEVRVSVGKEGRLFKPGSLIKVQHEGFKIGLGSGEIVELITEEEGNKITGFRTMERFDIAGDRDYYIDYYVVDETRNRVVNKQIKNGLGYTDRLMLTVPIYKNSDDVPAMGNILSALYGMPGETRVWESKRYIVTGLNPTQQGYDLTIVQYNDDIYDTGEIDPYVSSILKAAPKVFVTPDTKPYDGKHGENGDDGKDAVLYRLLPSTDSITRDENGEAFPGSVSCSVQRTTGNSPPAPDTSRPITFLTSDTGETEYSQPISIPTAQVGGLTWVEFRLYWDSSDWLLIDRIRIPIIPSVQIAPRYRGVVRDGDADISNSGVIHTNQGSNQKMNHDDYVMYSGNPAGSNPQWIPARMFQWNAINKIWVLLGIVENRWKYLDGINDLTEGAHEGIFSNVFASMLLADTAIIAKIFAEEITMRDNGMIKSDEFNGIDGTKPGFWLKSFDQATGGGLIEANNMKTKNMHAVNANIDGDSTFNGTLVIGDAWNIDGSVNNQSARGSIIALSRRLSGDDYEIRIKNLSTYGRTYLGFSGGEILFSGNRVYNGGTHTRIGIPAIRGNYTAPELYNEIDHYFNAGNGTNGTFLVSGTLTYSIFSAQGQTVITTLHTVILSCMEINGVDPNRPYWLYGMRTDGVANDRPVIFLLGSSRIDVSRQSSGLLAQIPQGNLTVGNNTTVIADFVFI